MKHLHFFFGFGGGSGLCWEQAQMFQTKLLPPVWLLLWHFEHIAMELWILFRFWGCYVVVVSIACL